MESQKDTLKIINAEGKFFCFNYTESQAFFVCLFTGGGLIFMGLIYGTTFVSVVFSTCYQNT